MIFWQVTVFFSDDCVKGRGRFYQGKVNVTTNGLECQRWTSQHPHKHERPPSFLPELQDAENYCRNAGGEEPIPWCFTKNSTVRWQYCNIPSCSNSTMEETNIKTGLEMNKYLTPSFILISAICFLVAIVICLLFILFCHRFHKHHYGYNIPNTDVQIDLDKLPNNVAYHR